MRIHFIALTATLGIASLALMSVASATPPSGGGGGSVSSGGGGGGGGGSHGHVNFAATGGYVSHGTRGYQVVGLQSAGLAHFSAMPRSGQASRVSFALGPRMGSAASAARMATVARITHPGIARMARVDRMHPRPGHPLPGHPPRNPKRSRSLPVYTYAYLESQNRIRMPIFCRFLGTVNDLNDVQPPPYTCFGPVKARGVALRGPVQ